MPHGPKAGDTVTDAQDLPLLCPLPVLSLVQHLRPRFFETGSSQQCTPVQETPLLTLWVHACVSPSLGHR